MFSNLFRAAHGLRSPEAVPLAGPEDPDPDPDLSDLHADLHSGHLRQHSASPGPATRAYAQLRHATADFTEADDDEDDSNDDEIQHGSPFEADQPDEDGEQETSNVLPLFSASHLDSLPVYSIVHAIRIIVQARTDTMLSWDQLRSPQVSQFLIKPMQQLVRSHHFSRATLYALMANCLQFSKEGQLFPGNAGTCSTRAKVCELLAIKLLKEYSTRELIDALSYDFNPLQGIPAGPQSQQRLSTTARTSTLEVAIRANAKHFLAHPLVVQQLEAIWNGAISFYSSADALHRENGKAPAVEEQSSPPTSHWQRRNSVRASTWHVNTNTDANANARTPLLGGMAAHAKEEFRHGQASPPAFPDPLRRRTVTLYNPRHASLFKLSRLRVPRYRQFLSTCSLAVLIGLFLSVLIQHSSHITTLELVFWFWSAGFMLDELVGFTEQGFSLYIMSFWNIFDLGILLLLIFYYSLRVCGVFLADAQRWNDSAYDILAANAILLLPRIFSVLDHYQYFSQLLIAFRLMAVDLAAVFVLIVISCSGFFVFFTLSRNDTDPSEVAYKIFQIIMGFTPAAWEVWVTYNYLGKILMALFLIICHFVIVTILVTVLSNSFMEIASNANEEHQFLFAINTISMVKNDSLFSYIAPTNIIAWMMMPLRYCMPLPRFVAFNRLVIKITHFPLLFGIFIYEKFFLAPFMYEPTDLVENSRRARERIISFADPAGRGTIFSPSVRLREESIVGYQKDRALDEVFRRTPDIASLRTHRRNERRKTQTAVRNWMDHNDGITVSNYSTLDGLSIQRERERERERERDRDRDRGIHRFRHVSEARSVASDPADLLSLSAYPGPQAHETHEQMRGPLYSVFKDHTDAEGDDELVTNDEDEDNTTTAGEQLTPRPQHTETGEESDDDSDGNDGAHRTPTASRFLHMAARSPQSKEDSEATGETETTPIPKRHASRRALHTRAQSTSTILFNPPAVESGDSEADPDENAVLLRSPRMISPRTRPVGMGMSAGLAMTGLGGPQTSGLGKMSPPPPPPPLSGQRSPRRSQTHPTGSRPQPIAAPKGGGATAGLDTPVRRAKRRMSSFDAATEAPSSDMLESASAMAAPLAAEDAAFATLPASFTSQLALVQAMNARASGESDRDRDRMSRLVLARMKTLEESFTDVVRELRLLKQQQQQHQSRRAGTSEGEEGTRSGNRTPGESDAGKTAMTAMTAMTGTTSSAATRRRVPGSANGSSSESKSRPGTAGRGKQAKGKEKEVEQPIEEGEHEGFEME